MLFKELCKPSQIFKPLSGLCIAPLTLSSFCVCIVTWAFLISLSAVPISSFLSWSQCATIGRMQIAAATGMNRWSCGSAGNASKLDRSGLHRGRLMMLLWIILSSSLSLMVDGQMKIPPETWVALALENRDTDLLPPNHQEEPFQWDKVIMSV